MGGGSGRSGRSGTKRKRGGDDVVDSAEDMNGENADEERSVYRPKTKGRRTEQLGGKKVDKEVYRNKRPKGEGEAQWSR